MEQKTKKICILAGIYPPDIGGPAVYSQRLAEELKARGLEAPVISYSGKLKKFPWGLRHFLYFLAALELSKNCDIILYAQTLFSAGIPGLIIGKIFGKKVVVRITGDHAWERFNRGESVEEFQNKKYGWRVELVRKWQTQLLKKFSKIIVPSQYLKRIVSGWGIPKQRIEVICNAAVGDLTLAALSTVSSREEAQKEIGIDGDIILSVGRLMSWKGFATLIEVTPDLLKKNPNFRLIIVGDGPEEKNLRDKIAELKLEDKVKLVGRIPHHKIHSYFMAAKLFVLNTGYEGFSHVILEAMEFNRPKDFNLPIITTNIGGNPELIENEKSGFLVNYNNKEQLKAAILRVIEGKYPEEEFKQNIKEKLKEFTWQNVINQTLAVFNSL